MAGPITWRTVGGGDMGAGNLAASGGQMIQQGLQSLQRLAADQQAINVRNQKVLRDNNTQDYLDQVAAIGTAGDLTNPETRQQLDTARLSYGNLIDRGAARGAVDQRAADLMKQEVQQNQFADMTLEREQRPLVEQLYQYARDGDKSGVDKMLGEVNFLQEGKLASDLDGVFDKQDARDRSVRQEARADRSESRQVAQFNESMSAAKENRELRREQFNDLREERVFKRTNQVLDSALADVKNQMAQAEAINPGGKISSDAPKDTSVIMKQLEDTANPLLGFTSNSKRQAQETIQKLLTDGVEVQLDPDSPKQRVKITPSQMQQFVDVHKGDFNFFAGGTADSINTYFREMYERNPGLGTRAIQASEAQNELRNIAKTLNEKKSGLLNSRGSISLDNLSGTLRQPGTDNSWDLKARQGLEMMPERHQDN
jgi:hypothetical protein